MPAYLRLLKNEYYDSVTLMSLTATLKKEFSDREIFLLMGTDMNLDLIRSIGFSPALIEGATPNDCLVGVQGDSVHESDLEGLVHRLKSANDTVVTSGKAVLDYPTLTAANQAFKGNVALISVPGAYAAYEAHQALNENLHVMLFSDNVSVEDEIILKDKAIEKGLLLMGPDCGTAILNGVGLAFANHVRRGNIGLVAASGTGLQEVTTLIDRFGGGISQAIGTGGRDLSEAVGGRMMMHAIRMLAEDPMTDVITLISKPPAESVNEKIMALLKTIVHKKVVIGFIDGKKPEESSFLHASTLAETAYLSLKAAGLQPPLFETMTKAQERTVRAYKTQGQWIRGLYCGGTLCSEAISLARKSLPDCYSNVSKKKEEHLDDVFHSKGHCFVDLGDDVFTNGRPHPMIEPTIRLERLLQEAKDPEVGVLLLDFELGYGSHRDPVGTHAEILKQFKGKRPDVPIIAYVCGTALDFQNLQQQEEKLKELGVLLASSHAQAVRYAIASLKGVSQ